MSKKEAKKRISKLKETIDYHRYLYHVLDKQEISEEALDSLKKELFDLEQKHPDLITPDSPTQRIGGEPLDKFKKTKHSKPMLSLNDAFSRNDVLDWIKRIKKIIEKKDNVKNKKLDFFCELKIDGLAFELVYKKGLLYSGATRGDGIIGENVTENLKTINSIPLKIKAKKIKELKKSEEEINNIILSEDIIVRGEAFISRNDFEKINNKRRKENLPIYSNPRNIAAGSIRQLDPKIPASRNLDCFIYDLVTDFDTTTHEQKHIILRELGFKVENHEKHCLKIEEVFDFYQEIISIRENLYYEIDGIVVSVNDNNLFNELGSVGKAPRGSIAYKFPLKEATTIVEDIIIQIGRTGTLTPVAILKPKDLSGVIVSRATLHNEDEIKRLGVKIKDTVVIGRAGDVIPDVIRVLDNLRIGEEKSFYFPKKCPACSYKVQKIKKTSTVHYCPNKKCPARQKAYLSYFVSKKSFNIEGLGEKIIDKLIKAKLISSPADIFFLKKEDLLNLEGFKDKLAENIINAINDKKKVTLSKLIYSLGIENVGEETSTLLENEFKTLDNLKKASLDDLISIKDIGEVTAENIYDWFNNKENLHFLDKLESAGINIIEKEKKVEKLKGKTFVLTGTLNSLSREKAKEIIKDLGGKVSESVSSKTDFVIKGNNPGSKIKKARDLGVKEIKEKDFFKMIK